MNAALLSSDKSDWCTPESVLQIVRKMGSIGLDPCGNPVSIVNAKETFYENGLENCWRSKGLIWVNPPFGRGIKQWIEKAIHEFSHMDPHWDDECIFLLPARTDTSWWHSRCLMADAICFWEGRITFLGAPAPSPFPSAFLYFGDRPGVFEETFKNHGWVVRP